MAGQLKRKGKFDPQKKFMKTQGNEKKKATQNAISEPNGAGSLDQNLLLYGDFDKSKGASILDDINGNQESSTSNVGGYTPTEFPLEAKLMQPSYALEQASSPSSDFSSAAPQTQTAAAQQYQKEFEFDKSNP